MKPVSTTSKGQIVIPAPLREKYHIKKGTKIHVIDGDGFIILRPLLKDPVKESRGILKGEGSVVKTLLEDRRWEAKHG